MRCDTPITQTARLISSMPLRSVGTGYATASGPRASESNAPIPNRGARSKTEAMLVGRTVEYA
jgi:hypothetical protein